MLFKMQEHDINETIREIHKIMDSLAREKGLNFVLNLADNLPKVKFDKDRIIQVMENLVNNAIKFTKEGKIEISTAQKGKNIQVKVSDTGIGLRTEDLTKIFYSFEQLQQGRSGKIEGTGLGLAICKEIIEQHKGKIWAESEGENKGSAFILILPL
jgi:signal transduction histidine kinase